MIRNRFTDYGNVAWVLLLVAATHAFSANEEPSRLDQLETAELQKLEVAERLHAEWKPKYEGAKKGFEEWAADQESYTIGGKEAKPMDNALNQMMRARKDIRDAKDELKLIRAARGSSPENIKAFWKYHAAKLVCEEAQTAYEKGTGTREQYLAAAKQKYAALWEFEPKPTLAAAADGVLTQEELSEQWHEARAVRQQIEDLGSKFTAQEDLIAALKTLEQRYDRHAAMPIILIALGDATEKTYKRVYKDAASYYQRAVEWPIPSDQRSLAQQDARKRLATLHEKHGALKEALKVLQEWKVSTPCGTGGLRRVKANEAWMKRLEEKLAARNKARDQHEQTVDSR